MPYPYPYYLKGKGKGSLPFDRIETKDRMARPILKGSSTLPYYYIIRVAPIIPGAERTLKQDVVTPPIPSGFPYPVE